MLQETNRNIKGDMGPNQRRFLVFWLLQRMIFVVVPGACMAVLIGGHLGAFIAIESVVLAFIIVWRYGLDIWQTKIQVASGYLEKFRKRVSGPAHYYVVVNGVQVRVPKDVWQTLDAGRQYEVYYSPRSKWLLSYRSVASSTNAPK